MSDNGNDGQPSSKDMAPALGSGSARDDGTKSHVLRFSDFRTLVATRFFSSMALQIQAVVVGWQAYELRRDPLLLGLLGLAEAIPAIGCAFVAGHAVDSSRPSAVYRMTLICLFLNACLLFVASWPGAPLTADARLALLFSGVFASGAARAFAAPSVFSLIPRILPRPLLGAAAAMNSSAFQIAAIVGPALGGLAFSAGGATVAFALPPVFLLGASILVRSLSAAARNAGVDGRREPFLQSISAGLKFAFGHKTLLSAMALDMFSVLFGGAVAVLPMFADQVFQTGPTGLGILRAAPSAGSAIVALWLATKPMKTISGRALLMAVAGFGTATIAFALAPTFWFAVACLAVTGAFDAVSMVIRSTILQIFTPDRMRGRVSAVSSIFITSSNEIGAFESGVAAKAMGLVPSVVFGGAMTLAIVAGTAWRVPQLARTRIRQQ